VTIGNSDDLGAFATARGTDREAPFFAPVKEASMKASSTRSLPRAVLLPAPAESVPAYPSAPTAGTGDGTSGTVGICPAVRATERPCPTPRGPHSLPLACLARADLDHPPAVSVARSVRSFSIGHRSGPSVRACPTSACRSLMLEVAK
jgi:hypothetical protein